MDPLYDDFDLMMQQLFNDDVVLTSLFIEDGKKSEKLLRGFGVKNETIAKAKEL